MIDPEDQIVAENAHVDIDVAVAVPHPDPVADHEMEVEVEAAADVPVVAAEVVPEIEDITNLSYVNKKVVEEVEGFALKVTSISSAPFETDKPTHRKWYWTQVENQPDAVTVEVKKRHSQIPEGYNNVLFVYEDSKTKVFAVAFTSK